MFGHNSQATIDRISSESTGWKEACSNAYNLIQQLQWLAKKNGIEIPNDLDLNCDRFFDYYNDNCY